MAGHPQRTVRRRLWPILKWGLCAVVLVFVGRRAADLWDRDELESLSVSLPWLFPAAIAYVVGWFPSAWYWRRLLRATGNEVGPLLATRAYFCGHLGKYVPGKAVALVIRGAMVKACGGSAAIGAVTSAFETLLMMGAGLAVGLALFPTTRWPGIVTDYVPPAWEWITPILIVVAVTLALPLISLLLRKFATIMTPRDIDGVRRPAEIDARLVAAGLLAFCVSWALMGLSLGFTLQAVSPGDFDLQDWPMWTGAVALGMSVGFIAIFAPGGMGVREWLLIEILHNQPQVGQRAAVAAAVLLRIVWLVVELAAAGLLFFLVRPASPDRR